MTLAAKVAAASAGSHAYSGRWLYLYYLLNPAGGAAHSVAINSTNNHYLIAVAADYTGVSAVGATNTNSTTGTDVTALTTAITVGAGSWVVTGDQNSSNTTPATGTNATFRTDGAAFHQPGIFDTNAALSAGSNNITINISPADNPLEMLVVEFVAAGSVGSSAGASTAQGLAGSLGASVGTSIMSGMAAVLVIPQIFVPGVGYSPGAPASPSVIPPTPVIIPNVPGSIQLPAPYPTQDPTLAGFLSQFAISVNTWAAQVANVINLLNKKNQ